MGTSVTGKVGFPGSHSPRFAGEPAIRPHDLTCILQLLPLNALPFRAHSFSVAANDTACNLLSFRIFGETGGLEWSQEEPNRLVHRKRDGF
jgi:hypothetical protein